MVFIKLSKEKEKIQAEISKIRQSAFKQPLIEYFTNPKRFIEIFLEKDIRKATIFPIWALGAMIMLSRILLIPLIPDSVFLLNEWWYIWFVTILMGLPVGFIFYILASYVIYILTRICKGKKDIKIVRITGKGSIVW